MTASSTIALRINNAEQFKESVSETQNTRYYLTFGKILPWANDSAPDTANSSVATENEVWRNMVAAKKITEYDMRHVIPRYDWQANTAYIAYDDLNPNLFGDNVKFYVMNSNFNVYKCLANNAGSNSTVEPTSTNPAIITKTTDGYIWKYMYTISDSDKLRFVTDNYIPVVSLTTDDGSLQWDVQDAAIDGSINTIYITNPGMNYNVTPNISISGDGTGAAAVAGINNVSNTVNTVTMTSFGSGYTFASITLESLFGEDAELRPIISPYGGHGSNPLYELGGYRLMINPRLNGSEGGIIPITNDYRQIAIIKDPLLFDSNTLASNSVFSQTMDIVVSGSGPDYTADEIAYQGENFFGATFYGTIVEYNSSANDTIKMVDTVGSPTNDALYGRTSIAAKFVVSVNYPDLESRSGKVLYTDNIKPITRDASQTEDIKILLVF